MSLGVQFAGAVLVGAYALSVPLDLAGAPTIHVLRLLVLSAGLILFVFTAPYLRHEVELGYWNFCSTLCLRVLTAGVFAVVLWGGLAIALAALNNLFGVTIPEKRYPELWVFVNGIFSTWFFLAGIPKDLKSLDDAEEYPKLLKIFSQYILLPLVLVYFVILYAYLGKILLAWEWPQGWVSGLILGFIATGFTSLLLLYPIRERLENVWITTLSRWFYVVIIPLTIMLFLAVWQRVSAYGFTEGRYLGIAAAAWLCVVTPYFIFSTKKKIFFIPASLCVVVFVVSFGPWGMFAVSEQSQVGRLREILGTNHILVDGRVQRTSDSLRIETTREISSIVGYLSEIHGFDSIQPWFAESLKRDTTGTVNVFKDPAHVAQLMGVTYLRTFQSSAGGMITLTADRDGELDIAGYERMLRARRINAGETASGFSGQGIAYHIGKDLSSMTVTVLHDKQPVDSLLIDVKPLVEKLIAAYGTASTEKIAPETMTIVAASRTAMVKAFFTTIRVRRHEGTLEILSFEVGIACK
jgi:hypothetical protein